MLEGKAKKDLAKLKRGDANRHTRVLRSLRDLEESGPTLPRLRTRKLGLNGNDNAYLSFLENGTPGAWRAWWSWGEGKEIIIHEVGAAS